MDKIIHRWSIRLNVDVKFWVTLYQHIKEGGVGAYWAAGWLTGIPLEDVTSRIRVGQTEDYPTIPEAVLAAFELAVEKYNAFYNADTQK